MSNLQIKGCVKAFDVYRWPKQDIWLPRGDYHNNNWLYDGTSIIAQLLRGSPDNKNYQISGMYIEYSNNSGAAVSPPTFSRDEGRSYYDGLSADATKDYLRVPLSSSFIESTDDTTYPNGNKVSFFASTTGTEGVHGKPFTSAAQSRVYGGALVAFLVDGDPTQDLVFARFYFSDTADQVIKSGVQDIGLKWPVTLT